jgi:hypothetical protein
MNKRTERVRLIQVEFGPALEEIRSLFLEYASVERKSPPFEGGRAAPAKRERDSAKHQEKAQTGVVFLESTDHLNHPACSQGSQAPLFQKEENSLLFRASIRR